jgi:hypothetical protein
VKITADTIIVETIRQAPATKDVYAKYKLRCPVCACRSADKVIDIALNYGVDLDSILRDLNAAAEK